METRTITITGRGAVGLSPCRVCGHRTDNGVKFPITDDPEGRERFFPLCGFDCADWDRSFESLRAGEAVREFSGPVRALRWGVAFMDFVNRRQAEARNAGHSQSNPDAPSTTLGIVHPR